MRNLGELRAGVLELVGAALLAGAPVVFACGYAQDQAVNDQAKAIHDAAIVVDAHEDTPQRFLDDGYDLGADDPNNQEFISLDRAHAGNLGAVFFSIWVNPDLYKDHYAKRALDLIDTVHEQVERHGERTALAVSADEIEEAHRQKKLAVLMGMEGGHPIENDLRLLHEYYRLGVRYMTPTWSNSNEWADAGADAENANGGKQEGLTDFGKKVVEEMNRLGMMVDMSHVSDKTFWDVMATTKAPVIASHSAARALTDVPRNMSDDMLKAVAKNGGVVNVAFASMFLDANIAKAAIPQHQRMLAATAEFKAQQKAAGNVIGDADIQKFELEWLGKNKLPRAPFKSLIDQIDHVAKIAGVDHTGIGGDFDGVDFSVEGINSAADLPKVTAALLERGYDAEAIKKILGGNMLRVMRDVERIGAQTRGDNPSAK
jgi:membrane dipeptidase